MITIIPSQVKNVSIKKKLKLKMRKIHSLNCLKKIKGQSVF